MSHQKRAASPKTPDSSLLAMFSDESRQKKSGHKRKRAVLKAAEEIDSISSSSSFSLSDSENDDKVAYNHNNQTTTVHSDEEDDRISSDDDESSMASQLSKESFFHQDDASGRRQFDNSILLYSTEVMKRLAMNTIQQMTEGLEEQEGRNQNQTLVLACDRHTKVIIENVRRRLRESSLPTFYASIAEGDTCKEGMERINKERVLDLEKTAFLSSKLVEQNGQLEKRLNTETSKRDKLREEEEWIRQMSRKKVHPLIAGYLERSEKGTDAGKSKKPQKATMEYLPPPPGTMAKLLDKITNKYT